MSPIHSVPREDQRWMRLQVFQLLLAGLMGISAFLFFSVGNDYPLGFHPDEYMKLHQTMSHMDLFYHPLLLFSVMRSLVFWMGGSPEEVVWIGRVSSAACGALAVVFGFLLGCRLKGLAGGIGTGIFLSYCPQLIIASHAIKEDSYLAAGLLAALWAITLDNDRRDGLSAAVLGLSTAFAVSAKYVGALAIPVSLGALLWVTFSKTNGSRMGWGKGAARLLLFLLSLVGAAAIINLPILLDWTGFIKGLTFELNHVTSDHSGLAPRNPHLLLFKTILQQNNPALLALVAGGVGMFIYSRSWTVPLSAIALTGVLYLAVLLNAALITARYVLPVTLCLFLLAALGAVALIERLLAVRKLYAGLAMALTVLALGINLRLSLEVNAQYVDDSRYLAREWVQTNLPSNARIMQDATIALPTRLTTPAGQPFEHEVQHQYIYSTYLTLRELVQRDIDFYVASSHVFERFQHPDLVRTGSPGEISESKRRFYEELFSQAQLVWAIDPDPVLPAFYSPEIRIFRLPDTLQPPSGSGEAGQGLPAE